MQPGLPPVTVAAEQLACVLTVVSLVLPTAGTDPSLQAEIPDVLWAVGKT